MKLLYVFPLAMLLKCPVRNWSFTQELNDCTLQCKLLTLADNATAQNVPGIIINRQRQEHVASSILTLQNKSMENSDRLI